MEFHGLAQYSSLRHRVFTRKGGTSEKPFDSLNISYSVGDVKKKVDANTGIISCSIGAQKLAHMDQVHGRTVVSFKKNKSPYKGNIPEADGIITDIPGLALMVKQADCQGVILFDPVKKVVSAVHSGWKGSVKNIIGKTVEKMTKDFNCLPENIAAAIGPSLGPCCGEFISYKKIFPSSFNRFMVKENYFDFWSISESQLTDAGLRPENIEKAGICTRCSTDMFFSYRGEGKTGRFATIAMIKDRNMS